MIKKLKSTPSSENTITSANTAASSDAVVVLKLVIYPSHNWWLAVDLPPIVAYYMTSQNTSSGGRGGGGEGMSRRCLGLGFCPFVCFTQITATSGCFRVCRREPKFTTTQTLLRGGNAGLRHTIVPSCHFRTDPGKVFSGLCLSEASSLRRTPITPEDVPTELRIYSRIQSLAILRELISVLLLIEWMKSGAGFGFQCSNKKKQFRSTSTSI